MDLEKMVNAASTHGSDKHGGRNSDRNIYAASADDGVGKYNPFDHMYDRKRNAYVDKIPKHITTLLEGLDQTDRTARMVADHTLVGFAEATRKHLEGPDGLVHMEYLRDRNVREAFSKDAYRPVEERFSSFLRLDAKKTSAKDKDFVAKYATGITGTELLGSILDRNPEMTFEAFRQQYLARFVGRFREHLDAAAYQHLKGPAHLDDLLTYVEQGFVARGLVEGSGHAMPRIFDRTRLQLTDAVDLLKSLRAHEGKLTYEAVRESGVPDYAVTFPSFRTDRTGRYARTPGSAKGPQATKKAA